MKKILLFLYLVFSINLNAQEYVPFPLDNANWNVFYASTWEMEIEINTALLQYSLQGDTTINATVYRKVCKNIGNQLDPIYKGVGGLREQEKKVYYFGESYAGYQSMAFDYEVLLYDFTKEDGDTVWLNVWREDWTIDLRIINYIITKIDSVKIGDTYRKRYNDCIVEGIGDVKDGLLGVTTPIPTCSGCYQEWEFICFSQNGETLYLNPNFSECYSTKMTSINEIKKDKTLSSLNPNPTKNHITLQFLDQNIRCTSIEIIDFRGNCIEKIPITNSLEYKLDLSEYTTGIYFMLVRYNDKIESHKVIKL